MENFNEHTLFFQYTNSERASIATFKTSEAEGWRESGSLKQGLFETGIRRCNVLDANISGACLRAIDQFRSVPEWRTANACFRE